MAEPATLIDLRDVQPYDRNARTHSPAQIEQIKESFRRFGWVGVCAFDDKGLLIGHGRRTAALEMWTDGETVMGPGKREPLPDWHAPAVDVTGLTDEERRALIIADNQLALNAGWDEATLIAELSALKDASFDLSVIGFDQTELQQLLAGGHGGRAGSGKMADEFLVPPFSVLNAREGWSPPKQREPPRVPPDSAAAAFGLSGALHTNGGNPHAHVHRHHGCGHIADHHRNGRRPRRRAQAPPGRR